MEQRGMIPEELNAVEAALLPLVAVDEEDDWCDECLTRIVAAAGHDTASAVVGSSTMVMVIHLQRKGCCTFPRKNNTSNERSEM
jgi:hypothetical protein